jgi:hypothetical protein
MAARATAVSCAASLVLAAGAAVLAASREPARTFDQEPAGRPPAGFAFLAARDAPAARWTVQREGANGFLAHTADASARGGFSLATFDPPSPGSISFSARTRRGAAKGSLGLVWRVQDAENYYLARLDLEQQDIGLYRIVRGNRVRIEGEDDLELDPNAWHTLKVVQEDEHIRVYLGGIRVLRARDRTFGAAGAAGVWCTGDAVAHFDDLRVDAGARR